MIILSTDMPKKCMDCQLLGHDEMYCTLYPRKDLDVITVATSKPDWCPIKCDIDDIKAEIRAKAKEREFYMDSGFPYEGLYEALKIIDKHISGKEQ